MVADVGYDTDDIERADGRAAIVVRYQRYALMFAVLGLTKDHEISARAGYSIRTIIRARQGEPVGGTFVANTIHTLHQHADQLDKYGLTPSFDELFAVVEPSAESRAA